MQVEFSAIEVPGEANPLTEGILLNVLRSASSTDSTQIRSGALQLDKWKESEGFYPLLQVSTSFNTVLLAALTCC